MTSPTLYRKRLIPNECIHLKDDTIIYESESILITQWVALKPKPDLHHGNSFYLLDQGLKISKFYREDNTLLYWYCDIVEYSRDLEANTLTSLDLLADVVVTPDGFVKVLDLDELAFASETGLLTGELLKLCLIRLDYLLKLIYSGEFLNVQSSLEALIL